MGGQGSIDRAFFELASNAPDVDKGFKGLLKTMAGTNDEVKRVQKSCLDLTNTDKELTAQLARLDAQNKSLSDSIKNGNLSTTQSVVVRKQLQDVLKEQEKVEQKYVDNQKKLISAHAQLEQATHNAGGSFQAFGKIVSDFATHPLQSAQNAMETLVASMGPVAVGITAIGAAAVTAAVGLFKIVEGTAKAAEQITNLANATGQTVEEVQALQRLGKERGLGDLSTAVERLNVQLGSDKGGEFTEAILRANVAAKEGQGAIFYLEAMRLKYKQMAEERGKEAAAQQAAADLGVRLFRQWGPVILDYERSITGSMNEIMGSWAVFNAAEIKHQTDINDKIERFDRGIEGLKNKLKGFSVGIFDAAVNNSGFFGSLFPSGAQSSSITPAQMSAHGQSAASGTSTSIDELARRTNVIAQADAIAAGTKRELIGLTGQLNDLQRQYTEEKAKEKSLTQFDEGRVLSLASQISKTKDLIKAKEDLIKTEERLANFDRYNAPTRDPFFRIEGADKTEGINTTVKQAGELLSLPIPNYSKSSMDISDYLLPKNKLEKGISELSGLWDSMGSQIANGISTGFKDGLGFARSMAQTFLREVIESTWSKTIGSYLSKNLSSAFTRGALIPAGAIGALNSSSGNPFMVGINAASGVSSVAGSTASSASFLGISGKGGEMVQAGAMIAGSLLVSDAWKRGGIGGALEGAAGGAAMGAAMGFAFGGPLGSAIGAGIGAFGGMFIGLFGGGERRRQQVEAKRASMQESKMFTALDAIDRVESFGTEQNIESIVSLTGKEILYSTALEQKILSTVNNALLNGGNQLSDNIAWNNT